MQRHPALVPLLHDHRHDLAPARRLRRDAGRREAARADAARAFLRFFAEDASAHFRDEEELLFPLVADEEAARPMLVRALVEHQQIRALVGRLAGQVAAGAADPGLMRAIGRAVESHIRFEERELFPLLERLVPEDALLAATLPRRPGPRVEVVDLLGPAGSGPVWGTATEDLNATLLSWPAGGGTPRHVNDECDVMLVVVAGSATVADDGGEHVVAAGQACIVPKGAARAITAGPDGVRYLSLHRRRPPLQLTPGRRVGGPAARGPA
jgi:quercetin dioxygenase-like cupin family protein